MSEAPKRTTARYARQPLDFFIRPLVRQWPDPVKLQAAYYKGCPHRTLEGFFRCPASYVASDLGWSSSQVASRTEILRRDGFVSVDKNVDLILLRDALAEQWPESPNVLAGVISRVRALPQSPLLQEFIMLAHSHCGRPESPPSARAFVLALERAFEPQFKPQSEPQSELLNLNLQSESSRENQESQSSSQSRRNGAGVETDFSLSTMRGDQEDLGLSHVKTLLPNLPLPTREEGNGHHHATPEAVLELWNARPGLKHIPKHLRASVSLLGPLQQRCQTYHDLKVWLRLFDQPQLFTPPGNEKPIELRDLVQEETFHMLITAMEELSHAGL